MPSTSAYIGCSIPSVSVPFLSPFLCLFPVSSLTHPQDFPWSSELNPKLATNYPVIVTPSKSPQPGLTDQHLASPGHICPYLLPFHSFHATLLSYFLSTCYVLLVMVGGSMSLVETMCLGHIGLQPVPHDFCSPPKARALGQAASG